MAENVWEIREQPEDPIGGATGEKKQFAVKFIGKSNNPAFPHTVANELVATQIGIGLGLNVPTVLSHRIGDQDFVLVEWRGAPPVTSREIAEFVNANAAAVHGAILFDLYVGNNDRAFAPSRRNMKLEDGQRLCLYDQGNACFYRPRPTVGIEAGIPRLEALERDLNALFDMGHKQNVYFDLLSDWGQVEFW